MWYADDTTLLADSEAKLQRLIDVVVRESGNRGLHAGMLSPRGQHGLKPNFLASASASAS